MCAQKWRWMRLFPNVGVLLSKCWYCCFLWMLDTSAALSNFQTESLIALKCSSVMLENRLKNGTQTSELCLEWTPTVKCLSNHLVGILAVNIVDVRDSDKYLNFEVGIWLKSGLRCFRWDQGKLGNYLSCSFFICKMELKSWLIWGLCKVLDEKHPGHVVHEP
jgi:hypothetical protein